MSITRLTHLILFSIAFCILASCGHANQKINTFNLVDSALVHDKQKEDKQTEKIKEFIKSEKEKYIALTDSVNLPQAIKTYYGSILDYLSQNDMDKDSYYIPNIVFENKNNHLIIPIYHFSGFEKKYKAQQEEKKGGTKILFLGNASGQDGNLEIDIENKKVINFLRWK